MLGKIKETASFIGNKINFIPEVGIILGTGLGGLVKEIEIQHSLEYKDIPNFPVSTVAGHKGRLIFGLLGGKKVVAMQGRFHFYEGYAMNEVVFPVRVMKVLGIKCLFVSNAAGGVNPGFKIGDIMIITDHLNLFGTNPLIGKNIDELGTRFPDMSQAYDKKLVAKAEDIAKKADIHIQKGTYAGVTGPTFETPHEYMYIRLVGADAVGMSTVPEVIVARHMSVPCFAISIITDSGVPGHIVEVTHEDVQDVASQAEPKMTYIMKEMIRNLD